MLTAVAFAAGLLLFISVPFRRKLWWLKLLVAFGLMIGPYAIDVVPARMKAGESIKTAIVPTTILLQLMEPNTEFPYGVVFDRINKAPERHAMWTWQIDQVGAWCSTCIDAGKDDMAMRGVQIAGNLAKRGSEEAVRSLGRALSHKNTSIRVLALATLMSLQDKAAPAREDLLAAMKNDADERVRQGARQIMNAIGVSHTDE